MFYALRHLTCACALGVGSDAILASYDAKVAPGMQLLNNVVPGRSVYFGGVPCDLPVIPSGPFAFRTNQLLEFAIQQDENVWHQLIEKYGANRVAIILGASNTGVHEAQSEVEAWLETGVKRPSFYFSQLELGTPSAYLRNRLGVSGPAYTVSTACSSSAKVFAVARRLLECGVVDAVIVGGVDGECRFALNGFSALGALSAGRCRPLAENRDGINLGEGVALFALERTNEVEAGVMLCGCGESSDAYHSTSPDPQGGGAEIAMRQALAQAQLRPEDIAYVNLHGTGTLANDAMECAAVSRVFGVTDVLQRAQDGRVFYPEKNLLIESTKALTGHCLGAAGAIEVALCWLGLNAGLWNGATMSNSFAFGGSNASVILKKV